MVAKKIYIDTPDGRYYVANDILYRKPNPFLDKDARSRAVACLLAARRAYSGALGEPEARQAARGQIRDAMQTLGISGPPWWQDGQADLHRKRITNTSYADWWKSVSPFRPSPSDSPSNSPASTLVG